MQISKFSLLLALFYSKSGFMYSKVTLTVPFSVSQAHTADRADCSLLEGSLESFQVIACLGKWPNLKVKWIFLGKIFKK